MTTYRNLDEVVTALATRLPDTEIVYLEATGYGYVPWEKSMNILDDIFGPFGWEHDIIDRHSDTERGIYSATVKLTVHAWNPETNEVITTTRCGTGVGVRIANNPNGDDTAIKGAVSDALSRAAKMLGNALARFLYDRNDPARKQGNGNRAAAPTQQRTTTPAANNGQATQGGPSAGQLPHLRKNGISDALIATLSGKEATNILSLVWPKDGSAPLTGMQAYERVKGTVPVPTNGKQPVAAGHTGDDFNF